MPAYGHSLGGRWTGRRCLYVISSGTEAEVERSVEKQRGLVDMDRVQFILNGLLTKFQSLKKRHLE